MACKLNQRLLRGLWVHLIHNRTLSLKLDTIPSLSSPMPTYIIRIWAADLLTCKQYSISLAMLGIHFLTSSAVFSLCCSNSVVQVNSQGIAGFVGSANAIMGSSRVIWHPHRHVLGYQSWQCHFCHTLNCGCSQIIVDSQERIWTAFSQKSKFQDWSIN